MVGELIMRRDKFGVFEEAFFIIEAGPDGEYCGQYKRELLGAHGLNFEVVVDGGDVKDGAGLAGKDPRLFC